MRYQLLIFISSPRRGESGRAHRAGRGVAVGALSSALAFFAEIPGGEDTAPAIAALPPWASEQETEAPSRAFQSLDRQRIFRRVQGRDLPPQIDAHKKRSGRADAADEHWQPTSKLHSQKSTGGGYHAGPKDGATPANAQATATVGPPLPEAFWRRFFSKQSRLLKSPPNGP